MSSKFKVAGVPRCATATDAEFDKPGTFEVNIGTLGWFDMVRLLEGDGNGEREHTRFDSQRKRVDGYCREDVGRLIAAAEFDVE
jgi:hypothetical protein